MRELAHLLRPQARAVVDCHRVPVWSLSSALQSLVLIAIQSGTRKQQHIKRHSSGLVTVFTSNSQGWTAAAAREI